MPSLDIGPDTYTFKEPPAWSVEVTNTGEALLVMGTVEADAVVPCARCLEDVNINLVGDIEGYFLIDPEGDADEDMPEDEILVLPDNHVIDLDPLIGAALIVAAPVVPLCREDCKGLCPVCGANLNEGDCGCSKPDDVAEFDEAANPFSVLKNYDFGQ